jgi:hypothetical protein
LHWDTATEGAGIGIVVTSDHADTSHATSGTSTSLISSDLCSERLLQLLVTAQTNPTKMVMKTYEISCLGVTSRVLSWNIGSHLHVFPLGSSTSAINHTAVRTGSVTVDLVESHHDHATGGDLRHVTAVGSHHCWDLGGWVVGSSTKSLSAGVGGLVLEASGVLLIWVSL